MTINGKIKQTVSGWDWKASIFLFKKIKVLTLEEEDGVVSVGSGTVASGLLACGDVGGVMVQSRSIRIGSSDGLGSFFLDLRIIFVGALQLS